MLIGILGLGMITGFVASIVVLVFGQSFLVALLAYTVVGLAVVLALTLLITVVNVAQKRRPEQPSFTR